MHEEYALLSSVRTLAPEFRPTRAFSIGGANSRIVRQIKADMLELPDQGLDRAQFGTLVAGKAVGLFNHSGATARLLCRPTGEAAPHGVG